MARSRPILLALVLSSFPLGCAQCPDPFAPPPSPVMRLHYPTGLALHPTEPILFVANSNFDLAYSDGAVVGAHLGWLVQKLKDQDRLEDPVKLPFTTAALVPSLGGPLAVTPDGKYLLHTTRQENKLVALGVNVGDQDVTLSCPGRGGEVPDCTSGSSVFQFSSNDPYGIAVVPEGRQSLVLVSLMRTGELHALEFNPDTEDRGRLREVWTRSLGDNTHAASLAVLPSAEGLPDYVLATARTFPGDGTELGAFKFTDLWASPSSTLFTVDLRLQAGAVDARGVALSTTRERAYVISKYPAAVVEVDVSRGRDGAPVGRPLRVGALAKEPSVVALYEPAHARSLVLTASYKDDALVVLDLETLETVKVLRDIGTKPFDIAVDTRDGLAFVSCFDDDTVAVVHLPSTPEDMRLEVVARLGEPRGSVSTNPSLPFSTTFPPSLPTIPGGL